MAVIATAEVRVIADTSRFLSNLRRQLRGAFSGLGGNLGRDLGRDIADSASREVQNGLNRGLGRVRLTLPATLQRQLASLFQGPFIQAGLSASSALADGMLRNENEVRDAANRIAGLFAATFSANDLIDRGMLRSSLDGLVVDFGNTAFTAADTFHERFQNSLRGRLARLDANITQGFVRALGAIGDTAADALTGTLQQRLRQNARPLVTNFGLALRQGMQTAATNVGNFFSQRLGDVLGAGARSAGNQLILGLLNRLRGGSGEVENEGRRAGQRFGTALIGGLTTGLRGLSQALSAISLRPLIGLAGVLRESSSEMISMAVQALALLALLESLSGILFALPAAVSVVGAAIATAAVAFQGFGNAVSAAFDDLDAFNEAIEDLAPAAQAVAREFRAIAPALTDLRIDVQQALFAQLEGTITDVADNLLGPLRQGMTAAASAMGGLVAQVGEFLSEAATADTVTATFKALVVILDALAVSAQPFLQGMRTLVDEFLPRIGAAAGPLAEIGERFRDWTAEMVASGQAMAAFDLALDTLSELGSIVAELGGIFQAMFSAAQLAGVDALGAIGAALEVIRQTFESFEGQVALANVFGAIGDAVTALAPVFATLITQLGLVFPIVGQIAQALGPSLSVVLEGLGQALLALGPGVIAVFDGIAIAAEAIAPALQPLGEALGQLLSAVAPLLPVIGELVAIVVELGAQIISVLASAIMPIAEAIAAALLPILPQLSDLFSQIVTAVAPLIQVLGEGLANVIQTLLPPVLELALALADALLPIFESLVPIITPLVEIVFQLAEMIGALLVPVISLLLPIIEALAPLFELVSIVLAPLLELLSALLEPITLLVTMIAEFLTPVIQLLAEIIGAVISAAIAPLGAIFEWLGGIISEHVIPWIEASVVVMQMLWEHAISPLIDWVRDLASTVSDRFGSIRDAVSTVISLVSGYIQNAIDAFTSLKDGISSSIDTAEGVLDGFLGIVDSVTSGISGFFSDAASNVSDAVQSIIGWVQNAIDTVSSFDISNLNPFADGGIVTRPTAALIGEAGKEVVIPLTRPQRAAELAQQSGLIDLLAAQGLAGGASAPAGPPIEMHVHSGVADAEQVARRAVRLLERRTGARGLERVR